MVSLFFSQAASLTGKIQTLLERAKTHHGEHVSAEDVVTPAEASTQIRLLFMHTVNVN